ncbi:response regulator transcription factor [Endothiovibrio diazotrophicus]
MTTIRVLVVEDDPDLNADLVLYLGAAGMAARGVAARAALEEALASEAWDVVVLDLGLPDGDGLEVAGRLAAQATLGLVILTARDRLEDRLAGWRSGAHVYLVKPVPLVEVAAVVSGVHQRLHPPGERAEGWCLVPARRELHAPSGAVIPLTHRESVLLAAFADAPDQGISRDLDHAQDTGSSIDSLVHRLRRKLRPHGDPIRTIYGAGYAFEGGLKRV